MSPPSVWLQYVVPQHLLSRLAGAIAECSWPWVRIPLITGFVRWFDVDMKEAERERARDYHCFNDFFTRPLRPGARVIANEPDVLVSPVDGTVSQCGSIEGEQILQAKGITYSVAALLGGSRERAHRFEGGEFATLYLSPRDYHRVHAPIAGRLASSRYIPGRLFSVDDATTRSVPDLYVRNERLVAEFETEIGPVAIVMIGAIIVGGISTVWHAGGYPPGRPTEDRCDDADAYARGQEIGRFRLGSTVVILTSRDAVKWSNELAPGRIVRLGESIASLDRGARSRAPES